MDFLNCPEVPLTTLGSGYIVVQKYRYNEFMGPLEMSSKICSFMPLSSDKKKSITYSSLYENLIHHPESQSSPGIAHLTLSPETP